MQGTRAVGAKGASQEVGCFMEQRNRGSFLLSSNRWTLLAITVLVLFVGDAAAAAPKISGKLLKNQPINGQFSERTEIKREDNDQSRRAIFKPLFNPNETVTILAESEQFNTRLRLLDARGAILLEDEDGDIGHNARLVVPAKQFDLKSVKGLQLELTSQGKWDLGAYKLSMVQGETSVPHGKEKIEADIAYFDHAASLAETSKAYHRQGWALAALAWNYSLIGQFDKLRENAVAAREIAERVGDKKLLALSFKNLGAAAWYRGKGKEAIPLFEKALEIRKELGDRKGEANSLDNLGITYQQLNDHQRAIDYFEQALTICRDLGDQRGESNELGNLGIAYYLVGDHDRAIDYYDQALDKRRKVGDRRGEAYDLCNLGVVYAKMGRYQRAIIYYELAVEIHRELGDRRGEGRDLENLAKACVFVGDVKRAVEYSQEAERIKQELNVQ
jgi:tetratricopeptide (TPR) repeat protein